MEENKIITVKKKTWEILSLMKITNGEKSINNVIERMIENENL